MELRGGPPSSGWQVDQPSCFPFSVEEPIEARVGSLGSVFEIPYTDVGGTRRVAAVKRFDRVDDDEAACAVDGVLSASVIVDRDHPNLVQCFGGHVRGVYKPLNNAWNVEWGGETNFVVEEFLPTNLGRQIHDDPSLATECTYRRMVGICRDVGGGLAHLHERKLIHLALKQTNILIDEQGTAKISHFGCYEVRKRRWGSNSVRGPLPCIAPEIRSFSTITTAVDVHAFGVMMAEFVTRKYGMGAVRSVSCPEELHRLITDCLKDNPDARPSAQDVVGRLGGLLDCAWIDDNLPWAG